MTDRPKHSFDCVRDAIKAMSDEECQEFEEYMTESQKNRRAYDRNKDGPLWILGHTDADIKSDEPDSDDFGL